MDLVPSLTRLQAALTAQLALLGGDDAFGTSAEALHAALEPAFRQVALDLAQQAAAEVGSQLPDHEVDLLLAEGEPVLRVRGRTGTPPAPPDELDARVTLRLPESLKRLVEEHADVSGDSLNSWVVKTLASRTLRTEPDAAAAPGQGEFET